MRIVPCQDKIYIKTISISMSTNLPMAPTTEEYGNMMTMPSSPDLYCWDKL